MRILVLEDDEERQEFFSKVFKNHTLDITKIPEKANELLSENQYDYIFLDHDLAPEHYINDTPCNKTTGLCTAEFIEEHPELCAMSEIIIHSLNPNGSERMLKALRHSNVKKVPFTQLLGGLTVNERP